MANVFKKAANYLGLVEEEEDAQSFQVAQESTSTVRSVKQSARPTFNPIPAPARSTNVQTQAPVMQAQGYVPVQEALPIMDQIFTIHPRFYNEARTVGERYRTGQPVLMNLSDMDESERKRLVDFASGLVFGLHGSIERVTSKVFLLTPANVRVSTENKAAAAEASFFNQS
jgi:cell division inhibitor SepF